ncbi:MAG: hypothetical protein JST54_03265 [Deltaproteobacteria bacterium]|nr:hypothetical protein [Deltaproteobacteria bacterium]
MRVSLVIALGAALVGCSGGSNGPTDAGKPDAGDPVKVFGLDVGDCYELSSTDQVSTPPSLGAAIESDSTNTIWYLPDGGSTNVSARTLVYRQTGSVKMTDYLYVDEKNVLLLKRDVAGAEQTEYHPGLVVARVPLKANDHLDQNDGGIRQFGGDGGTDLTGETFTFDVTEGTLTTPGNPAGADAFTYNYSNGPDRLASWSFVAGTGTVELSLQLPGDQAFPVYKLQNTRQLAAGDQTCGSAQP